MSGASLMLDRILVGLAAPAGPCQVRGVWLLQTGQSTATTKLPISFQRLSATWRVDGAA